MLQLASEPLSPPVPSDKTDRTPECDLDLDVTLEPKEPACEEEEEDVTEEPVAFQRQSMSKEINVRLDFIYAQ